MSEYILPLDPSRRSTDTIDFQKALRSKIVGQGATISMKEKPGFLRASTMAFVWL